MRLCKASLLGIASLYGVIAAPAAASDQALCPTQSCKNNAVYSTFKDSQWASLASQFCSSYIASTVIATATVTASVTATNSVTATATTTTTSTLTSATTQTISGRAAQNVPWATNLPSLISSACSCILTTNPTTTIYAKTTTQTKTSSVTATVATVTSTSTSVTIVAQSTCTIPAANPTNAVVNGDFESGCLAPFTTAFYYGGTAGLVAPGYGNSSYAYQLTADARGGAVGIVQQLFLVPNMDYTISYEVKASVGAVCGVILNVDAYDSISVENVGYGPDPSDGAYHNQELGFYSEGGGPVVLIVEIICQGAGSVAIDNIIATLQTT